MDEEHELNKLVIPVILILIASAIPGSYAEIDCFDATLDEPPFQYKLIESADHSITTGELTEFCVEPNYKRYKIYLDVQMPGTLTITVPKDIVDLKQFDYDSCNSLYGFSTNVNTYKDIVSAKQIAQTVTSRTLEFTWSEPIEYFEYFGTYAIVDDVDYSEPNYCIELVESGEKSAEIEKIPDWRAEQHCPEELNYNYHLDHGSVTNICFLNAEIVFYLHNIDSTANLIVDIPYTHFPMITEEKSSYYLIFVDGEYHSNLFENLQRQNSDYQTYEVELPINSKILEIIAFIPATHNVGKLLVDRNQNNESISNNEIDESSCKSNFMPIMSPDGSRTACVKPTTIVKLVERGWIVPP